MANPPKRPRNTLNLQVTQHIRPFKLVQQFPSNIKVLKSVHSEAAASFIGKNTLNLRPMGPCSTNIKLVPNKALNITNKLQKLKLKSADGRDLGEFNVKYLAQSSNAIGGKTITLTKHSSLKKLEEPVAASPSQSETKSEESKAAQLPVQVPVVEGNSGPARSYSGHNFSQADTTVSCQSSIGRSDAEESRNEATRDKNPQKRPHAMPDGRKVLIVQREGSGVMTNIQRVDQDVRHYAQTPHGQKLIILETENRARFLKNSAVSTAASESEKHPPVENSAKVPSSPKELVEVLSKASEGGRAVKLLEASNAAVSANTDNIQRMENKSTVYTTIKGSGVKRDGYCFENQHSLTSAKNSICGGRSLSADVNEINSVEGVTVAVRSGVCFSQSNQKSNVRQNNIIIPSNIIKTHSNANAANSIEIHPAGKVADLQSRKSEAINTACNRMNPQDLTNNLNILQKVLSSVKDQELRDKAFKALADCGISMEKLVPLRPPSDMLSIRESIMQTDVFGLLEPNNFIIIKEDSVLERKEPIEKVYHQPIHDSFSGGAVLNNNPSLCLGDDMEDFDFLKELLDSPKEPQASMVHKVLSRTNSFAEKAAAQLKRDFNTALKFDDYGMLSIHRAVKSGKVRDVQRQVLVLKALRENVDVSTTAGKTSLELAVQNDADASIVKILLEAGAQPAFSESIHESAVIIASRISSPILSNLIRHVQPSSLLDALDSEGFASIHYCAQQGNTVGIKALIAAGANVNLRDGRSGRTPLFHALEGRYVDIALFLLRSGAISNVANFGGQTAMALIDDLKNLTLVELMNRALR